MDLYNQQDCFVLTITGSQMEVHCSLPDRAGVGSPAIAANDMSAFPAAVLSKASRPALAVIEGVAASQENGGSIKACADDIVQGAKTIAQQLEELRKITQEFSDFIRKL